MLEPIDPDVEAPPVPLEWDVVAAVAAGGIAGSEARYGLGVLAPHASGQFPWMTLLINAVGCLLIGVLIETLLRRPGAWRLTRPLLATGVLGGFTTFSAFSTDAIALARADRWALAAAYLVATVVLCVAAAASGMTLGRRA